MGSDFGLIVATKKLFAKKNFCLVEKKKSPSLNQSFQDCFHSKISGNFFSLKKSRQKSQKKQKDDMMMWRIQKRSYPIDEAQKKKRKNIFFI